MAAPSNLAADIEVLRGLDVEALRTAWAQRFLDAPPPVRSADLLRRIFAERIQQEAFGRDLALEQEIARLVRATGARAGRGKPTTAPTAGEAATAKPNTRRTVQPRLLAPGAVLVREWQGEVHHVEVLAEGFRWKGERYASLSVIARAITGSRWNGPRFFGLREKVAP
jgi:hypothetical protein